MSIKVTKRATADGARYSISGLTYGQIFRIKHAMYHEEERMKFVAGDCAEKGGLSMAADFKDFAKDAREVFTAISGHI